MFDSCVFCKIVRKEAPSSIVYEDEVVAAFMSIRPVNIGHTLVVPKKHYENIYEIPDNEVASLFNVTKRVALAVKKAMIAEGIRIVQNNGAAAGQVIFHLHVHIIPMYVRAFHSYRDREIREEKELEKDAKKIRQCM